MDKFEELAKVIELIKNASCTFDDVLKVVALLGQLSGIYYQLINSAGEFNRIAFASRNNVEEAVDRAEDLGDIIDEVIKVLGRLTKDFFRGNVCAKLDLEEIYQNLESIIAAQGSDPPDTGSDAKSDPPTPMTIKQALNEILEIQQTLGQIATNLGISVAAEETAQSQGEGDANSTPVQAIKQALAEIVEIQESVRQIVGNLQPLVAAGEDNATDAQNSPTLREALNEIAGIHQSINGIISNLKQYVSDGGTEEMRDVSGDSVTQLAEQVRSSSGPSATQASEPRGETSSSPNENLVRQSPEQKNENTDSQSSKQVGESTDNSQGNGNGPITKGQ